VGFHPAGQPGGGFLTSAFGALPTLLILTGIMCGVAAAATFARGMRQLPPPSRAGKPLGNPMIDADRDARPTSDNNSS
jgi:hypothetical protein